MQIFICDASAEAGRLLTALQSKGYAIVDVPLGLLPSRVLYEIPDLVICDADAREAKRHLSEMLSNANEKISILLLGHENGALAHDTDLRDLAIESLVRPLDIGETISRITTMAGPASQRGHLHRVGRSGRAPILVASARRPYRSDGREDSYPPSKKDALPDDERFHLSLNPGKQIQSDPPSGPGDDYPLSSPSASPSHGPPSSGRVQLSPETEAVLEAGRRRVVAYPEQSSRPSRLPVSTQSTGGEIREEFVLALTEALDADFFEAESDQEEQEPGSDPGTSSPSRNGPSLGPSPILAQGELTNPGGRPDSSRQEKSSSDDGSEKTAPPLLDDLSDLLKSPGSTAILPGAVTADSGSQPTFMRKDVEGDPPLPEGDMKPPSVITRADIRVPTSPSEPPERPNADSETPGSVTPLPPHPLDRSDSERGSDSQENQPADLNVWVPSSALLGLAQAIQERRSGALAQQEGSGIRRIVLLDGDISTVSSSIESESLAHFLHSRGDLGDEILGTLGSIPRSGRHAGAALIARGLLAQDSLWAVLRAHAEWILGKGLLSPEKTHLESQVPGRILEEPAVFGGAAGTEIYLDALRRVLSPRKALSLLGGPDQVLAAGASQSLLNESALNQEEQRSVLTAIGQALRLFQQSHPELLPVLLGLCHLGVLSSGGDESRQKYSVDQEARSQEMDDDAFTARLMTRRALVEDGDYFCLLGIARSATGYEVDRARDELLEEYSDDKLNARTIHLRKDLLLLRNIIGEAHLVLRDDVRRLRYRQALEALPS